VGVCFQLLLFISSVNFDKAWHIVFESIWKDFRSRFNGILESLARYRKLVDKEAISIEIVESRIWRDRIDHDLEQQEKIRRASQLQDTIGWLAVEDRLQADDLDRLWKRRQQGTGDWVFKNLEFSRWIDENGGESVLWLKGIPGAGMLYL